MITSLDVIKRIAAQKVGDILVEQLNIEEIKTICESDNLSFELLKDKFKPKSRWIYDKESRLSHCDKCGFEPMHGYWGEQDLINYCPVCGAVMNGYDEDCHRVDGKSEIGVLIKVRNEIAALKKDWDKYDDYRKKNGLYYALKIVDKYIGQQDDD